MTSLDAARRDCGRALVVQCGFDDVASSGVRHAVEVGAETLYEGEIEVKNPNLQHTVIARNIAEWLAGGARSPREAVEKRRLRELLDT